ncbi:MAG: hypothetical protein KF853_11255 [Rhodocyclaceae bacterium]|jgi:hypothetical protein|nr:hypothetical protein [Rhodocyclaceae bacterium]MBX3677590.1 hypothetical protein [Rhodocyclaceae bacterium]MCP5296520.1 hypothetical protein [Zoogloeaceae bacterium]
MFKLWSNPRPPDGRDEAKGREIDGERLRMLAEHFPIGKKIRYFPEFQRDIVFHTIIIAWRVNDHFIYSREAVEKDGEGMPTAFIVGEKKTRLPLAKVRRLQLMVPDTTDMERSLDYVRRAALGPNGQFVRGNAITLISDTCHRGIPSVDTQVDIRLRMKDGPYADNQMVLLRPELETLMIADQRQKARVPSHVPVSLYLKDDAPPVGCILGDFSDVSLRLLASPGQQALPPMKANDKVVVILNLGDAASIYRIRGSVLRTAADACVIKLKQLYKDGDFSPIKTMDILEIKTGLLNLRF